MQFSRLRISGFKSFVDPAELLIEPGVTGIVGPNGCGKSNLVEALRWVMGESSAKRMRGEGMDDVIFNGTATRPPRNLAEVTLHLTNDDKGQSGPSGAFAEGAEIEVVRRIERGSGSSYRINGKEARARDVQLMFADAASGARSTAMVSQGQIGEIISAKPAQRRHLLEEAAGISGLHSRRHEAELRLRAAETNLERLDDVLGTLQTQLQALKRQARQASRYRSLNDRIRKAEASVLYHRWASARAAVIETEARHDAAVRALAEAGTGAAAAAAAQTESSTVLPGLRDKAAAATAAFHRVELALERLDEEAQRIVQESEAIAAQVVEIEGDRDREAALHRETLTSLERLAAEKKSIDAAAASEDSALSEAQAARDARRRDVEALEKAVAGATGDAAAVEARRTALDRRIGELDHRLARLAERLESALCDRREIEARLEGTSALSDGETSVAEAGERASEAQERFDSCHARSLEADGARETAEIDVQAAREQMHALETGAGRIQAEIDGLAALMGPDVADGGTEASSSDPVVDRVTVEAGWEVALGAALGDDLMASLDRAAPAHWLLLTGAQSDRALPDGAAPLAEKVDAPEALARRLAQVGIVENADGAALQSKLAAGQRLIDREGTVWRWDGLVRIAGAPTAEATRLKQRNRLAELRGQLDERVPELLAARSVLAAAKEQLERAGAARARAQNEESEARRATRDMDQRLNGARQALIKAETAATRDRSRIASLAETAARLETDHAEAAAARREAEDERKAMPEIDAVRAPLVHHRARLAEKRTALEALTAECQQVLASSRARRERLSAIGRENDMWRRRATDAEQQIKSLSGRRALLVERRSALADKPAAIEGRRRSLLDQRERTAADRTTAGDALAEAETRSSAHERASVAANEALSSARESNARIEGQLEQARVLLGVEETRVRERLDCPVEDLLAIAEAESVDQLPSLTDAERRLDRLLRERETLGAVNLRAEIEVRDLSEQITTMETEREDLIAAIAKLRAAITSLNREGRQRLLRAFDEVNGHFQTLFEQLFGGGHAHLALVDDDDPLLAGLEIMACPPGKRLQSLSLLSGGEKALAALSLLFAVFLTNPAPICVLDEVDAPLDDSNVDRYCSLVERIARECRTRFLIVTHHRLTMARVHRLFGVTMSEAGVSQLVSVDLGMPAHLEAAE